MMKLSFGNITVDLNILSSQRQSAIFDEINCVNWLDVYICDDLCDDGLIENNLCDEIGSLSPDSSNSLSFVAHAPNPMLELKPLPNSLE